MYNIINLNEVNVNLRIIHCRSAAANRNLNESREPFWFLTASCSCCSNISARVRILHHELMNDLNLEVNVYKWDVDAGGNRYTRYDVYDDCQHYTVAVV